MKNESNENQGDPGGTETGSAAVTTPTAALSARLEAMRQRARRLLITHGAATLVSTAVSLSIVLVALDWALWFPAVLRFGFGLVWLTVLAWIISKHIAPPILTKFTIVHMASKVEERFPEFQDRLTSALSFIAAGTAGQDPLQQKLIERTADISQDLPIEQAISTRPAWRVISLSVLSLVMLLSLSILRPDWVGTGLERFMFPFGALEWPRTVHIQPLTYDLTIARGESVVVAMEVDKGQSDTLRGFLVASRGMGSTERIVMRREGPVRYAWTLNSVVDDLTYWFEAGDDTTRSRAARIRVLDRPKVIDLSLSVLPPDYIWNRQPLDVPAGQQTIEMIEGSTLAFGFKSSKPLDRTADGRLQAWVASSDGERFYAVAGADDSGELVVEVSPSHDQLYEVRLMDDDGFENGSHTTIEVLLRQDAPPSVAILKPVEVLEITPNASVEIVGVARDDLGVSRVRLMGGVRDRSAPFEMEVPDWQERRDSGNRVTVRINFIWSVKDLSPKVGDVIEYRLAVEDNRFTQELEPQEGRSYQMLLKVLSESQFTSAIAEDLNRLAKRLRRHLSQQEQMRNDTENLRERLSSGEESDVEGALLSLSGRQMDLADRIVSIRKTVESLSKSLSLNGIEGGWAGQQSDLFIRRLQEVVEPAMQQAGIKLNACRGSLDSEKRLTEIVQSRDLQQTAIQAMRSLLDEFTLWDDYHSVMINMRELLDLQQQVSRRTGMLQQKTLGRHVESLPEPLQEEIAETARRQDRVSEALERAISKLEEMQEKLRRSEPEDALALAETRRKLQSGNIKAQSDRAAGAIRANKTGQAQEDQNRIERALTEAIAQLEQRQSRKLAQLSKHIGKVEEIIRSILAQQEQIRSATQDLQEDAATSASSLLARRQRNLERTTLQAVEAFSELTDAGEAAQQTRLAARDMARATDALYKDRAGAALTAQADAVARLQQILAILQVLREDAEQAIEKARLFALKRALLAVRKRQLGVNKETGKLLRRFSENMRRTRILVRRAKKQAAEQKLIIAELGKIEPQLAETPVYLWVIQRVNEALNKSEKSLRLTELDEGLIRVQQRALGFLDQLIDAINQAEDMVDEQFAEGDGGGGAGQGQAADRKPVPTVAELIVLKGIQQTINRGTRELAEKMDIENPTAEQLQIARDLGEDQKQLRALAVELTEKARQGR